MASTSETGHGKNVANFKTLIVYLESLGVTYAPSKPKIFLPALQAVAASAATSLSDLKDAFPIFSQVVDDQEAAFKPLNKLVTKVVRAYKASVDNPAEAETVISLQKKIAGTVTKPGKLKKEAVKEVNSGDFVSSSQVSYDNRVFNFEQLVKVLKANADYAPNEAELQVATLELLAADLRAKTEAVDAIADTMENSRVSRNNILYTPLTGIIDLVQNIKNYVSSVFGGTSSQLKYINKLQFRGK